MDEYINREVAIQAVEKTLWQYQQSVIELRKIPVADVAPMRHGRWLHRKNGVAYCSECEVDTVEDETNYCPNCGCRMDLED